MHHVLKALAIKKAKPADRPYKMADGGGLYLLVNKAGKYWRFDYRFDGRRKTLALGVYPTVNLDDARQRHHNAKRELELNDIDPASTLSKKARRQSSELAKINTVQAVCDEWLSRQTKWADTHRVKVELRLRNDVYPVLGARDVQSVSAPEVLQCLRLVESRGAVDSAHRIKHTLGQVFRYAIATGRAELDPTSGLRGALSKISKQSYPHITDPRRLGEVLRAIDGYAGSFEVRQALRLLPLVFTRPGELSMAEWAEFDIERAVWTIPAERMKRKHNGNHIVPLSRQAQDIVKELREVNGNIDNARLVFPGARSMTRAISDNSLNAGLRRLDVLEGEHVAHGFRHTASTLLNEQRGFDPDLIEVQLHHADRSMRGKYNKAAYFDERRKMMQAWSDYLDELKHPNDTVVSFNRAASQV